MSKFKVGDRVRIVFDCDVKGLITTVTEITEHGSIKTANGDSWGSSESLELLSEPQYTVITPKVGEKYRCIKKYGGVDVGDVNTCTEVTPNVVFGWQHGTISNCYLTTEYLELVSEPEKRHIKVPEGYFADMPIFVPTPINQSLITKSMNFIKNALLSKEDKTLIKAGFLNEDLSLTSQGKQALEFITFKASKKELVTMAEEQIAEEKE